MLNAELKVRRSILWAIIVRWQWRWDGDGRSYPYLRLCGAYIFPGALACTLLRELKPAAARLHRYAGANLARGHQPRQKRKWLLKCNFMVALDAQYSVLSTQHSVLSTQHSALSTQHSALTTQEVY